ncbi:immunity 22 family protein [Paenibacillus thiaminolyticus]|uniref:immunity 22 family protein n=1 Tax=Paenibacillus thiaminolyticus TaxID=49283 RepID=UPI003D2B5BB1
MSEEEAWEQPGIVSLWVGRCGSEEELERYLTYTYTEDGDGIAPPFADDFRIFYFDVDFREAYLADSPGVGLAYLLAGCSCEEEVIPRFMQLHPEPFPEERNAVILLYNFAYHGHVRHAANEWLSFDYIGLVRYE